MRNNIAPFHFVNPLITSSNGNLSSISRDLPPGIPKNGDNLNAAAANTAEVISEIGATAVTVDSTEMPITTREFVNSPIEDQKKDELLPSVPQESHLSTVTDKSLLSPAIASDMTEINQQVCTNIHCQNNGTCVVGNDGRVSFNFFFSILNCTYNKSY